MSPPVVVTLFGGVGEIGRNMATLEVDGRIGVIDCGVTFPGSEHLGVDLILPDWSALRPRGDDVTSVFLTHGHEDHIGALPYLLQDFPQLRIHGTRLTLALLRAKFEEWPGVADDAELIEVVPGQVVRDGPFEVEVVQVTHSIPDGCALAFRTPHGLILHSGDFKLDMTPIDGRRTDIGHLTRLGDEGVALLLADSTNADAPGYAGSESTVAPELRSAFSQATGLIVVASFASHVHRIQQVLDAAAAVGRRPVFVGRSMVRNMAIAADLGILTFDHDLAVDMNDVGDHDRSELVIVSTGSQGEPFSALSLMAAGEHRHVDVRAGDLVVLASSMIPGNEEAVYRSINGLTRAGARVLHRGIAPVHVSGHAYRDDLILYHSVIEPEFFVPVHGEWRHLVAHKDIAVATGCLPEHVLLCTDGDTIVLENGRARMGERVTTGAVYVDGLLSDVGPAILRDRRRLGADGVCVCVVTIDTHGRTAAGRPLIVQRGVVRGEPAEALIEGAVKAVTAELEGLSATTLADQDAVARHVTQSLGTYWRAETGRRPVLIPLVLEV